MVGRSVGRHRMTNRGYLASKGPRNSTPPPPRSDSVCVILRIFFRQGSDKPLDADSLLPLLVHALAHADLPRAHEALNFLRNFRGGPSSWGGEEAYYVTCM